MQMYATFDHNIYLEMAISTLEKNDIEQEHIFAVPLDNRQEPRKLFDTLHRSDGISLIDIGAALGTAFSVIGVSIGFKMAWGPIWIGLIAAVIGALIGIGIRLLMTLLFRKRKSPLKGKQTEVILIIDCPEAKSELVEDILWEHFAFGVAKISECETD